MSKPSKGIAGEIVAALGVGSVCDLDRVHPAAIALAAARVPLGRYSLQEWCGLYRLLTGCEAPVWANVRALRALIVEKVTTASVVEGT